MQFPRQKVGDGGRCFDGGARIEKERARAPGENIFDRARHLMASRPNDFAGLKGRRGCSGASRLASSAERA